MYSALISKEQLLPLKKLVKQINNYGVLENTYKEYQINTYIDLFNYSETPVLIQTITDFDIYASVTRIPAIANDSSIIELGKGDLIIFQDRELEIDTCRKVKEKQKEYFLSTLAPKKQMTTFNIVEEELYRYFFMFFKKLGIEGIRHSKFYQNRYFQNKDNPFILYFITEKEKKSIYTSQIIDNMDSSYRARTNKKYNILIRLYDKGEIIDLDTMITKNRIFNLYADKSLLHKVKEIKILDINYLTNEDTYINDMLLNEKVISIDFYVDTTLDYQIEAIDKMELIGGNNE